MLRAITTTEPAAHAEATPSDLIPRSVLALDLDEPSVGGWHAHLAGRDIAIMADDIGRPAITRTDARRLISERRDAEARAREVVERNEQRAVELDKQWRAQLPSGVPWYMIPDGVSPTRAMMQAEYALPRRRSVLEDALSNSGTTLHIIGPESEES